MLGIFIVCEQHFFVDGDAYSFVQLLKMRVLFRNDNESFTLLGSLFMQIHLILSSRDKHH